MERAEYLNDPHVASFLDWAAPLATGTRALSHHWHSPKWGSWSCETLFGEFEAYDWPFRIGLPGASATSFGRSGPSWRAGGTTTMPFAPTVLWATKRPREFAQQMTRKPPAGF